MEEVAIEGRAMREEKLLELGVMERIEMEGGVDGFDGEAVLGKTSPEALGFAFKPSEREGAKSHVDAGFWGGSESEQGFVQEAPCVVVIPRRIEDDSVEAVGEIARECAKKQVDGMGADVWGVGADVVE